MSVAPPQPDVPDIDRDMITRFVEVVFGYLEGYVAVRALSETGTQSKPPQASYHPVDEIAEALARKAPQAARDGRGLYVVPGTLAQAGSARASDIVQTGILLIDLDAGDISAARDHLVRHIGPPTLEVASGGRTDMGQNKLHLYWRLTEPAAAGEIETVRRLRETVALNVGGDTSFKSLHQPIRVPGTVHGKNGRLTPVRITADRGLEYDLADLEDRVSAMPDLPGLDPHAAHNRPKGVRPRARDLATKVIRSGGVDGTTRFEALSSVIGHWVRNVRNGRCSLEEAWAAVRDHNAAMIQPPWDQAKLRHEFEAILARDMENHAAMERQKMSPDAGLVAFSDDALAAVTVARHGPDWRYTQAWGAWHHWTGKLWAQDEIGGVRECARQVCRQEARKAEKPGDARRIASDKTIAAALRIVQSDPAVSVGMSAWDRHQMLLNTPAGLVDLTTGEMHAHDRSRLITQIANAAPGDHCPRWTDFVAEIADGNTELQNYLKRLAGYCLTGVTTEQVFAFFHGAGANGKSVFLQTIAHVLGDYAATATLDTFMTTRGERHLSELAGLRAARLVLVPETEAGKSWAEARIKQVTGGEKIRANFMRRDFFEFRPQFKLIVAGNHRPSLSGVGEAMRRRLHVVPFDVVIPEERRDRDLPAKLIRERDGILGWMLEGCREWQQSGLMPPDEVRDAGTSYLDSENVVGHWIEECCETGANHRASSRDLFQSWSAWAEGNGHAIGSQKSLGEALRERGFAPAKVHKCRGWLGIAPARRLPAGGRT